MREVIFQNLYSAHAVIMVARQNWVFVLSVSWTLFDALFREEDFIQQQVNDAHNCAKL